MTIVNKFLGLSLRGDYLSYSLIFNNSLHNLGSIDIKSSSSDHFSKINSVLSIIKSEVDKEDSTSLDSTNNSSWNVGIYHDPVPNKHNFDQNKFYKFCRLKTIIECSCCSTLSTSPLTIETSELCKTIAKVSNSKISDIDGVVNYASSVLSKFITSPLTTQFNGIATSWATALSLKRRHSLDSLVLSENDTLKIQARLKNDKVVNDLITNIEQTKNDKSRLKNALERRVHKLVQDYVENIVQFVE
ncbi:hypothetical protein TpMuguga_02g00336 [Theileria parva strain Muguga]|uniref:uncharacterized protein n=1 Tax=Theileria parva strain Muguga TaxID=333668 RepID=UPI001C620BC7|nr:uncharacterized protein TpMuguga_02g00336 [Theileria parva strain Muguga]EAN32619.2 hypothetical protein TpMuguga_02g00336 [Theileria parva strain Muguga]